MGDGVYQGLSETEFSALGLSYDGVIFSDGETQVVYYNQLDERWKYELYGTDTIGGYACGPTAMSIVVCPGLSAMEKAMWRLSATIR